jgi:hypothetical protein
MSSLDLPSLVLHRNLTRIQGMERQVQTFDRRYMDREDLPGIKLLIRGLSIAVGVLRREVVDSAREPGEYRPPEIRPSPVDPSALQSDPLDERLTRLTDAVRDFEKELGVWFDLLTDVQGQALDALAQPFVALLKKIPGLPETEIIFRPMPRLHYVTWKHLFSKLVDIVGLLDPDVCDQLEALPRLVAVEYPLFLEEDTFLHALLAHELAHLAFECDGKGDRVWREAVAEHKPSEGGRGSPERRLLELRLFTEAACDRLAVRMVGPAYALAFIEYTLTRNVLRWPPSKGRDDAVYPELPWRLARIDEAVDDFLIEAPQGDPKDHPDWMEIRSVIERWRSVMPSYEIEESDLNRRLQEGLKKLDEDIGALLGDAVYPASLFVEDMPLVWQKLAAGISPAEKIWDRDADRDRPFEFGQPPPGGPFGSAGRPPEAGQSPAQPVEEDAEEWSRPMDWRSILNGCYLRWLADNPVASPPRLEHEGVDLVTDRMRACEMLQGALELSELQRQMLDLRRELSPIALPPEP